MTEHPLNLPAARECPYCAHANPELLERAIDLYVVTCEECHCEGPPAVDGAGAVNAWNRRSTLLAA